MRDITISQYSFKHDFFSCLDDVIETLSCNFKESALVAYENFDDGYITMYTVFEARNEKEAKAMLLKRYIKERSVDDYTKEETIEHWKNSDNEFTFLWFPIK